jgi:hypothetical protein
MKLSDIDIKRIGNTVQLIGGVWAGDGDVFFIPFPEDGGELQITNSVQDGMVVSYQLSASPFPAERVHVLSMDLEDWKRFLAQTDLMETEVMARARDGSLVKAVMRKSQRQIDQNVSWAVFRRDGYACRYCGRDDVPLTVDHLLLWEEGGRRSRRTSCPPAGSATRRGVGLSTPTG